MDYTYRSLIHEGLGITNESYTVLHKRVIHERLVTAGASLKRKVGEEHVITLCLHIASTFVLAESESGKMRDMREFYRNKTENDKSPFHNIDETTIITIAALYYLIVSAYKHLWILHAFLENDNKELTGLDGSAEAESGTSAQSAELSNNYYQLYSLAQLDKKGITGTDCGAATDKANTRKENTLLCVENELKLISGIHSRFDDMSWMIGANGKGMKELGMSDLKSLLADVQSLESVIDPDKGKLHTLSLLDQLKKHEVTQDILDSFYESLKEALKG